MVLLAINFLTAVAVIRDATPHPYSRLKANFGYRDLQQIWRAVFMMEIEHLRETSYSGTWIGLIYYYFYSRAVEYPYVATSLFT